MTAFAAQVDDEVLRRAPRRPPEQSPRDALFEIVMCRLDVLEPWKASLRSMAAASGSFDPVQIAPFLASQRWMLEAAGIGTDGLEGGARVAGLGTVYASVFRTWLDDDDPGLARTMAALDRRLRRGEQAMRRADDLRGGVERAAAAVWSALGWRRTGEAKPRPDNPSSSTSSGP